MPGRSGWRRVERGHVLDDAGVVEFVPFDLLYMSWLGRQRRSDAKTLTVVTFSSACLAPALLFEVEPVLGFGEAIVPQRFLPPFVASRLLEEADLRAASPHPSMPRVRRMVGA